MIRLILIRHAKSGWDDPMADDHDRTLTERGHKAAAAIGAWLAARGDVPDVVLCSDAMRTQQTAKGVIAAFETAPTLKLRPALYHASPDTVIDEAMAERVGCVAVIGHNPGIGMAAHGLVKTRPAHGRFSDYPTCATTIIDFPHAVLLGEGELVDFVVPRDLTD